MNVSRRLDHTWKVFIKRTIAAQIHLMGFILAFIGLFILLHYVNKNYDRSNYVACFTFGATAMFVFGVSSLYHFLHDGFQISVRLEYIFEKLDHFSIYGFIAGSYTAILINSLTSKWLTPMIIFVWVGALFGILYTTVKKYLPQWMQKRSVYTSVFLLLGWGVLFRVGEIYNNLLSPQLWLLVGGVTSYTLGALIYIFKKPNISKIFGFHELWHLCVVMGFGFHYVLVLQFYLK